MRRNLLQRPRRLLLIGALALALLGGTLIAAPSGTLSIGWWTVDGGGGTSSGGAFSLSGTSGQPDAGTLSSADGRLRLEGGFWPGGAEEQASGMAIFMPLTQR